MKKNKQGEGVPLIKIWRRAHVSGWGASSALLNFSPRPSHKQNKTNKKESEKGGENKDLLRAFERSCHSLADIFMLV